MKRHAILSVTVCVVLVTPLASALADAAGDLKAGRDLLAQGDATKALPLLQRAAQALPRSVDAQFSLGQAYLQLGRLDKALEQPAWIIVDMKKDWKKVFPAK